MQATKTEPQKAERTAPAMMRAAVLAGPRQVRVREAARPRPGPGEVRVRLEGSGVCASNLPLWEGRPWFDYPQEPGAGGHEGWGRVDAVGPEVEGVAEGDRVAALSGHAHAEYDVAPADEVVVLPEALAEAPFPGEPLGCAMNIFRRSDVRAGQAVAVVGVGFLGALLVGLAAQAGARVVALSRRPFALEMARTFGAGETIQLGGSEEAVRRVMDVTDEEGCDRVIEATGKQAPLNLAARLTRVRGRLVIAGYHQDGPREVDMQLWNWRGLDVINAHERDPQNYVCGIREAARAVAQGRLGPSPLYTHTFALDELGAAFRTLQERPDGFMKALITV